MRKAGVTKQSPDKHPLTLGSPPAPPSRSPRFVCKNNGVLFENQLLQIGVKSEFRQNLGMCVGGGGRCEDGDSGRPCSGVASGLTEAPPPRRCRPHVSLLRQQDLSTVPELHAHCHPPWGPPDSYPLGLAQPRLRVCLPGTRWTQAETRLQPLA